MIIGIYDGEIYIQNGKTYNVIRPVEKSVLESLRTIEGLKYYCFDDYWKNAVVEGYTELGLDDYLQELLDGLVGDDDFPCKDSSFVDEVSDEELEVAEEYLLEKYGIEVGTWESAGWYEPDGEFEIILRDDSLIP